MQYEKCIRYGKKVETVPPVLRSLMGHRYSTHYSTLGKLLPELARDSISSDLLSRR